MNLGKILDEILKTFDGYYKSGYLLYALIGLILLIGLAIWRSR